MAVKGYGLRQICFYSSIIRLCFTLFSITTNFPKSLGRYFRG